MFEPRIGACLHRAAQMLRRGQHTDDAALLDRLARDRDPAAFAELLTRHGPAVWALCRRLTRCEADAEDVFQATFLVLTRDAARVRKATSVGSWLYGVAARIGKRARTQADRIPDPLRLQEPNAPPDPTVGLSWNEVRTALDEELVRLPDALRAPILLCYFDGMTQDEAAAELGWRQRTVKARVARARELLRARLTRRGIELPAVLAVPLLSTGLALAVPPRLHAGLVSAVAGLGQSRSPGPDVSPAAIALARTEVPAVSLIRTTLLLTFAAGLLVAGSLVGQPIDPGAVPVAQTTDAADPPAPAPEPEPKLPAGAVRIGTTEFRPAAGWHKKVFFTADGKTIVAPQEGKVIELWNPETGQRTHEIPIPKSGFHDSDYFAKGSLLAIFGTIWPNDPAELNVPTVWLVDTAAHKVVRALRVTDFDHSVHHTIRFTPDGKRLIIGIDGEIRVWDVKSGEELLRQKHKHGVDAMAVSPDGKMIAFGRYDVYLWKWESGEEPKKFASIGGFGTEMAAFGPDSKTLLVAGSGGRVMTFDAATGRQTGTLELGGNASKWSFSPDGQTIATTYYESTRSGTTGHAVVLWDPTTGKERARFSVGRTEASDASWSPDGSRIAAATDYRLWVWDVKTKKLLGPSAPGHEGFINAFAFGPDGRLYTASDDHTIRSWDATTGKPGLELIHDSWVRDVAVSPDGSLVVGSALRNDLRIWDTKTGTERFKLLGNGMMGGKRKVRFTPDGKKLVAWGDDFYLRVWDTRNGKLLAEHRTLPDGITEAQLNADRARAPIYLLGLGAADISADGTTFAFCPYRIAQVFDVETGKEQIKFEADPNGVSRLALSPDGKRLAIGSRGKQIETRLPDGGIRSSVTPEYPTAIWDLAAKKIVWQTTSPGSWSGEIGFSPDGKRLAEVVSNKEKQYAVRVWDAGTGKDLGRIELSSRGDHIAFDRAGKRLAVAHWDTTATLFDLETALKPSAPK